MDNLQRGLFAHLPERDKRLFITVFLGTAVAVATLPFLTHEPLYNSIHDLLYHLTRIQSIADGLKAGQFPVRLYDGFVYGYGYPSGVCYPDTFLYLPALLVLMGLGLNNAYLVFMLLENVFCAVSAYFCFKAVFSSRIVGAACSALWTLSAYRLMDMALRACVGEAFALCFLPLLAYGIWGMCFPNRIGPRSKSGWIAAGVAMAGIVQSHVLSVLIMAVCGLPVVLALAVVSLRFKQTSVAHFAMSSVKAIVLCVLLSLWFIVPFLDYYLTEPMLVGSQKVYTQESRVELVQLFSFMWPITGANVVLENGTAGEMPLALGWALALAFPSALCFVASSQRSKMPKPLVATCVVLLVFSVLLVVLVTVFPWRNEPGSGVFEFIVGQLAVVQFPWRFIGPLSFLLVLILGIVFSTRTSFARLLACVCIALAFVEAGVAATSFAFNTTTLSSYDYRLMENKDVYLLSGGEYLPKDIDPGVYKHKGQTGYNNEVLSVDPFADGPIATKGVRILGWDHQVTTDAVVGFENEQNSWGAITLPLFSYSEWSLLPTESGSVDSGLSLSKNHGLVVLNVPPNAAGTVRVSYQIPLAWRISEVVSLMCALVLVGLGCATFMKKLNKKE